MPTQLVRSHAGVKRSRRTTLAKNFHKDDKDEPECSICHLYLHMSGLECDCCPGRRVCLHHADNLCECDPSRWRLVYRYSLKDLESILQQVSSHTPGEGRSASFIIPCIMQTTCLSVTLSRQRLLHHCCLRNFGVGLWQMFVVH